MVLHDSLYSQLPFVCGIAASRASCILTIVRQLDSTYGALGVNVTLPRTSAGTLVDQREYELNMIIHN